MSGAIRSDKNRRDAYASDARLAAQAKQFVRLCFQWAISVNRSPVLRSVTLYPPSVSRNGAWLVVCKVWDDGDKKVGFHRASDPLTALLGALTKLQAGALPLKDDTYSERQYDR